MGGTNNCKPGKNYPQYSMCYENKVSVKEPTPSKLVWAHLYSN